MSDTSDASDTSDPIDPGDTSETSQASDTTGILDEALERLHTTGPERNGWLTNHAPMAVEALVHRGQAPTVHRWLDHYAHKLEELPPAHRPVTADDWREALGDPARITDWTRFFARRLDGPEARPWREVLAEWWPRLLPGIAAGSTHPVIRTGHAVRTLLTGDETAPRRAELANLSLGALGLLMVAPTVFLPTYAQSVLGLGPI
ncbi:questin oxidase family protein, partial [Streptomyces sp. NPDC042898]|uniref:questin oxidase family protein n=1 Tax=Streptomyces sp. NPDC042898 TaxID=3154334 RepID=UPI0033DF66C8